MVAPTSGRLLFYNERDILSVYIINPSVCELAMRRGIGAGVSAVYATRDETHGEGKAKNKPHARPVDSRGIRLSEANLYGGTLGATGHWRWR
jgi:hypothetical protein